MSTIAANLQDIRRRISEALQGDSREVRIVAVSKSQPLAKLREAHAAGCRDVTRGVTRGQYDPVDAEVTEDFQALSSMVNGYFCHQIDESAGHWTDYESEFKVFPCVEWDVLG